MPLSKGDYINYYWTGDARHIGYTDGDGYRLYYVVSVGHKWVKMLNLANLCAARVSRTVDMRGVKHLPEYYQARLPAYIDKVRKVRCKHGLQIAKQAIRMALEINGARNNG